MDELHTAVERLLSREYDESLVRLAKESGRELYNHLSTSDRHSKIASMVFQRNRWTCDQVKLCITC